MNLFAKLFLAFIPISIINAPEIKMIYGQENLGGLWAYRTFAWFLIYFLLYISIKRMTIDQVKIGKAIGYCALISAVYAWLQFFNFDQFQYVRDPLSIGWHNKAPNIAAMIGSGFYLSNWLCLCLPFCLSYMPWWASVIICGAIFICHGYTSIIGMALILALYGLLKLKDKELIILFVIIIFGFLQAGFIFRHQIASRMDGRYEIWHEVYHAWHTPPIVIDTSKMVWDEKRIEIEKRNQKTYALTGRGPGSFEFFFEKSHPGWNDPHNIYLRVLYEYGLMGEILLLCLIITTLRNTFRSACNNKWCRTLFVAFCAVLFCSLSVPVGVIEPLRFYSVLIFSLISI